MRGFTKAAALLFCHGVVCLVIPDHAALNQPITNEPSVDQRMLLESEGSQFVPNAYTTVGSDEATLYFSSPVDTLEPNEAPLVLHPPFPCRDPLLIEARS